MLKNIKSKYCSKIIFNFIANETKLKIIKYNKNLQHLLDTTIINYMILSGRYIKYLQKNKAEEYDFNDNLIYEGEYLNGKRNGKGKEYLNSYGLIFSGEYLNGKRNGKGKEYELGTVIFNGEYLNGKKNGNGKEYYYFSKRIRFKGEYNNGKIWNGYFYDRDKEKTIVNEIKDGKGFIKEYNELDEIVFAGEYKNGERNGKGKEYDYSKNVIFEGEYLNGRKHGKGKDYRFGKVIFKGEYLNGKKWNGIGYDDKNNLICEFKNGNGFIKKYGIKDKIIFEGEFINGEGNGKAKEYYDNNKENYCIKYEGEYLNGKRNGKGKEYDKKGKLKFEGEFLNGKRNGKGKEFNRFGLLKFEGEYMNDYRIKGKEYIKRKLEYEGEYLNNKKWNGKGYDLEKGKIIYKINKGDGKIKEYNDDGKLIFDGEYLNGKRNGKGKEYDNEGNLIFEGEYLIGKRNEKGKNDKRNKKEISSCIQFEYVDGKIIAQKNCLIV